tara:strand:- start:48 stop:311 length:264 start_codon:yes stop_codon:yes gene_type:complete
MSWVKATIIKTLSGSLDGTYWDVMDVPIVYVEQTGSEAIVAYSASYSNDYELMEKSDEVIDWGIQKSQELEQSDSSGRKYSYKITRY